MVNSLGIDQAAILTRPPSAAATPKPVAAFTPLASCGGNNGGSGSSTIPPTATTPPSMTTEQFSAILNGSSEVPPDPSAATATGTLTVETAGTVTTSAIAGTVVHIHQGAVGVSGAIIFPLTETFTGSGVWGTTPCARLHVG
jgi:hypothetical protein